MKSIWLYAILGIVLIFIFKSIRTNHNENQTRVEAEKYVQKSIEEDKQISFQEDLLYAKPYDSSCTENVKYANLSLSVRYTCEARDTASQDSHEILDKILIVGNRNKIFELTRLTANEYDKPENDIIKEIISRLEDESKMNKKSKNVTIINKIPINAMRVIKTEVFQTKSFGDGNSGWSKSLLYYLFFKGHCFFLEYTLISRDWDTLLARFEKRKPIFEKLATEFKIDK